MININRLPVFPLPIYLLPQGVTRLRIFEQRYLRMVKQCAGTQPFVLTVLDKGNEFNSTTFGAQVDIIDFEPLKDSTLGITIKAQQMLSLKNFSRDDDGLLNADVTTLPHWPHCENDEISEQLALKLQDVFQQHPPLHDLYPSPDFNDPTWVNRRWLEVLPLTLDCKSKFVQQNSFNLATNFIKTIVLDHQFKN